MEKKVEIPKVQLPSGDVCDDRTIVAISRLGTQSRVYYPEELRDALNLKEGDLVGFLRVGKVLKPRPGLIAVVRLELEKKVEIPKVQLPSGDVCDDRTIVATSRLGTQSRVYYPEELGDALKLKEGDMLGFLRVGKVLKPRPGLIAVVRLEDHVK